MFGLADVTPVRLTGQARHQHPRQPRKWRAWIMRRTFTELRDKMTPEQRERADAVTRELLANLSKDLERDDAKADESAAGMLDLTRRVDK